MTDVCAFAMGGFHPLNGCHAQTAHRAVATTLRLRRRRGSRDGSLAPFFCFIPLPPFLGLLRLALPCAGHSETPGVLAKKWRQRNGRRRLAPGASGIASSFQKPFPCPPFTLRPL